MLADDSAMLLLIEAVCGAAGGMAVGRWSSHGIEANALFGAIGGLALTWLAARVPWLGRFVGGVEGAVDSAIQGTGGINVALLVGVGIAGLLGGCLLVLLVAAIRSRIGK